MKKAFADGILDGTGSRSPSRSGPTEWASGIPNKEYPGVDPMPEAYNVRPNFPSTINETKVYLVVAKAKVDQAWKKNPGARPLNTSPH